MSHSHGLHVAPSPPSSKVRGRPKALTAPGTVADEGALILSSAMRAAGVSQRQLADFYSVSRGLVARWCNPDHAHSLGSHRIIMLRTSPRMARLFDEYFEQLARPLDAAPRPVCLRNKSMRAMQELGDVTRATMVAHADDQLDDAELQQLDSEWGDLGHVVRVARADIRRRRLELKTEAE